VLPSARRRGVGTTLLREGVAVARELARDRLGCETRVGDEQSLRFATRRGFEQWALEVELVRVLQGNEAAPPVPGDLEIVPLARRPDLLGSAWEVCESAYRDLPIGERLQVTRERWLEEDVEGGRVLPDLTLVAVQAGRVVAFVGMLSCGSDRETAENGLTAVRPERRGEGLGTLLKGVQASRAAAAGYRRLVTFTQEGNDAMRRVNERLGYVEQPAWMKLVAAVGDVERALAR
jgi:mycothiol synthase